MPLISVIVPVYNDEVTIQDTIESVLNQSFQDFELIIINDGSTDATLEVIKSIQDSRIKVSSYLNAGVSKARNRGISQAVGQYISFIDADDLWTADKLEAQFKTLQVNPQAAVAYSWTDYIDESGQFLRQGCHFTFNGDVYTRLLLSDFIGSGSNPLIRTQTLEEVGGFNPLLTHAEDWDLWLRLAACYEFVAVPYPQILYRISLNSASANVWEMEKSSIQVIEQAFAQAPESIQNLKPICLGNRYKGLTWKTLAGLPKRRKGLTAIRFFLYAISNDFSLLQKRITWKVLWKISIMILFPPQLALKLFTKFKYLSNLEALLVHIRTEP